MDLLKAIKWLRGGVKRLAMPIAIVFALLGIGLYFKHFTQHVDHPVEQAVEDLLKTNGIDIDFSEDKKD